MKVDCPVGDVVDKITILRIKERRLTDARAVSDVQRELKTLIRAWQAEGYPALEAMAAYRPLAEVNEALWEVEDALRDHEQAADFGPRFIELARSVYRLNDQRAALKRQINQELGSRLIEHKSYGQQAAGGIGR